MIKTGYIYKITSPSGKIYIGKTCRLNDRITNYRNCSGIKRQHLIYNSINKYGWDNHIFEIIDQAPIELLCELEKQHIKNLNSFHKDNPNGMNLTGGGDGVFGRKDTPQTIKKRVDKIRGSKRSQKTKDLMSSIKKGITTKRIGTKHTKESIEKMSKIKRGKSQTDITIEKRVESMRQTLIKKHGAILQIDKNTKEIVKEWVESIKNISRQTGFDDSSISKCLKNKANEVKGFIWKYKY